LHTLVDGDQEMRISKKTKDNLVETCVILVSAITLGNLHTKLSDVRSSLLGPDYNLDFARSRIMVS
jgi:hypothetical protein